MGLVEKGKEHFNLGPAHPTLANVHRKRKNSGGKLPSAGKKKARKTDGIQQQTQGEDSDMDEDGVWLVFLLF